MNNQVTTHHSTDEQAPIESNFGAMRLITDCWKLRDGATQWQQTIEQLHGASMVCDDTLFSDLSFLVDIGRQRLAMAKDNQS